MTRRCAHPPMTQQVQPVRYGIARVLSKRGVCSRSQAERLVREGRVSVDGRVVRDPERPTDGAREQICLDGKPVEASAKVYIALNKPRGIVVSAADERGRDTVYSLIENAGLPWLGPVGRLDRASEGLLLLTNDTAWAAGLTEPQHHVDKLYHVQIDRLVDDALLARLSRGVTDAGDHLTVRRIELLRQGEKTAWLAIVLDEGRNRHIRRLLAAHQIGVRRLIRIAIGSLALGDLAKGSWRHLDAVQVQALRSRPDSGPP